MGLEDDPFDWRITKDGQLLVSRGGRVVTTVRGSAATQCSMVRSASSAKRQGRLAQAADDEAQQLLARATGNYKRGNERHG